MSSKMGKPALLPEGEDGDEGAHRQQGLGVANMKFKLKDKQFHGSKLLTKVRGYVRNRAVKVNDNPINDNPVKDNPINGYILPAELFIKILEYVRRNISAKQYFDLIRCCKYWHHTGVTVYFQHIELEIGQLFDTDRYPIQFDQNYLSTMKSFEVRASYRDTVMMKRSHLVYNSGQVDTILPLNIYRNLTSFTLSFSPPPPMPCQNQTLSAGAVQRLLDELPETVIHLGLDIPMLDYSMEAYKPGQGPWREHFHLCHTLAPLLLRLQTLSLRTGYICTDIFACLSGIHKHEPVKETSPLTSAVFNFDLQVQTIDRRDPCDYTHWPVYPGPIGRDLDRAINRWHYVSEFHSLLQKLREEGHFPKATELKVFSS